MTSDDSVICRTFFTHIDSFEYVEVEEGQMIWPMYGCPRTTDRSGGNHFSYFTMGVPEVTLRSRDFGQLSLPGEPFH